jgi:hypothetical protein
MPPSFATSPRYASADALASAAPRFSPSERELLRREPGGWSPADVPLLDEAAEILGEDNSAAQARAAQLHRFALTRATQRLGVYRFAAVSQRRSPVRPGRRQGRRS